MVNKIMYTCACGWKKSSNDLDECARAVIEHGRENHPELEINEKKIYEYLKNKDNL
jgi:predicted small metal-binding protein